MNSFRTVISIFCLILFLGLLFSDSSLAKTKDNIRLNYSATGVNINSRFAHDFTRSELIEDQAYHKIKSEHRALIGEPGGPAMPVHSRWIKVPQGRKPDLQIHISSLNSFSDILLEPFPENKSENPNGKSTHFIDQNLYNRDEFFPPEHALISDVLTIGDDQYALVDISPYRYNPAKKELIFAENIDIEVNFTEDINSRPLVNKPVSVDMRQLLMSLTDHQQPRRDNPTEDILGHLVIVTLSENLYEIVDPLAEWKRKKGYKVTVTSMEEIGGDRRENLAEYLEDAWDNWDVPPTHVLLSGDVQGRIPLPYYDDGEMEGRSWHATDVNFVHWEGDEDIAAWIPEAFIGRLPAATSGELEDMVEKILAYEASPNIEDQWVEGAVLIAAGVGSCILTNVSLREMMMDFGYNRNDIHEAYAQYHQGQIPDLNVVRNGINAGVGFVNFRGYQNWGGLTSQHIHGLSNREITPVVTGMVCGTNDYTNSWGDTNPECRGESFLRATANNRPTGGVACYGPTDLHTHTWFNNTMNGEFYKALFHDGLTTLGAADLAAKLSLLRNYPSLRMLSNGMSVGYYFFTYNMLGDPSMQVWTKTPSAISVDYEGELAVGTNMISATVVDDDDEPIVDAYVHVFAEHEDVVIHYGAYTDDEGRVDIQVEPLWVGDYFLTVTGTNLEPAMEEFRVVQNPVALSIADIHVDDDNEGDSRGNDNHEINPGELIELTLGLLNCGEDDCSEFSAELRSNSALVRIQRNQANFPASEPGQPAVAEQPFLLEVSHAVTDVAQIPFELVIPLEEQEDLIAKFRLDAYGYDFAISELVFGGNGIEPGNADELIIRLRNQANFTAPPTDALLACDDPNIQIRRAESRYSEMESNQQAENNNIPFLVFAGESAFPLSTVKFGLLLVDENSSSDSIVFPITLGGDPEIAPQGPNEYGYWAFDSRDVIENMNPEYDWVNGQQNLGLNDVDHGGMNNYAGFHGETMVIDLPWDFTYFGQEYSQLTINTNGYACFGRSSQISWNNQEIGSGLAPAAILCPYWTDMWNGSVYRTYDEDNGRLVIEWRNFRDRNNRLRRFAIHLYDPEARLTRTGDGEIIFMYHEDHHLGNMRDYPEEQATIGIGSPDRQDGITITHANQWNPRSEDIEGGMAIRFTTGEFTEFGSVAGTVTSVEDGQPIENVRVMVNGTGFFNLTDEHGEYEIHNIPIDFYTFIAQKRGYNESVSEEVEIELNQTGSVDFELTYPDFNIDIEEIRMTVEPDSTAETNFTLSNTGNGPLDYNLIVNSQVDRDVEWEQVFNLAVGDTVDDNGIYGITSDNEYLYLAGMFERNRYPHKIYIFDYDCNMVGQIDQHSIDSVYSRGYFALGFNGENLLAVERENIIEITREGEYVDHIESQYDPTQAITFAPERGTIFHKSMTHDDVLEIDTEGNLVESYAFDGYTMGFSWFPEDEEGFYLYMMCRNREPEGNDESNFEVTKLNPETGEIRHVTFLFYDGDELSDRPLDCTITKAYDPLMWTFVVLAGSSPTDRAIGFNMGPNLTWMRFDPAAGTLEPNQQQLFTVNFFAQDMPEQDYRVDLEIYHNAFELQHNVPIYLRIGPDFINDSENPILPNEFQFDAPYPNPFNSTVKLSFRISEISPTSLKIYDLNGRLVRNTYLGELEAGHYQQVIDGKDMSSGIYLIQLDAGTQALTRKAALVK